MVAEAVVALGYMAAKQAYNAATRSSTLAHTPNAQANNYSQSLTNARAEDARNKGVQLART